MKVQILIDFKEGYDTYRQGEVREMSAGAARKFAGYGWVAAQGIETAKPFVGEQTLNIHDGLLGHTSEIL